MPRCRAELDGFLDRAPSVERGGAAPATAPTPCRDRRGRSWPTRYPARPPRDHRRRQRLGPTTAVDPGAFARMAERPVRVVREPAPGGSNARNRGLREASGEIVVFADDDVVVDRDWLTRMADPSPATGGSVGRRADPPERARDPGPGWFEGRRGSCGDSSARVFDLADPPRTGPCSRSRSATSAAGRTWPSGVKSCTGWVVSIPPSAPATPAHDGDDSRRCCGCCWRARGRLTSPPAIVLACPSARLRGVRAASMGIRGRAHRLPDQGDRRAPPPAARPAAQAPAGPRLRALPQLGEERDRQRDFPRSWPGASCAAWLTGRSPTRAAAAIAAPRRAGGHANTAPQPSAPAASLRVLIVTDEYAPLIGGAGRCIELFSRYLADLGHTVAIATAWHPDAPADRGRRARSQVHRIRDLPSRMRWISEDRYKHNPPPFPDPEAVPATAAA